MSGPTSTRVTRYPSPSSAVAQAAPELSDEDKAAVMADIEALATSEAWKQELATRGWDDRYLAGEAFEAQLAADIESTGAILKDIGLAQ